MTIAEANAVVQVLRYLLDPDNVIPAEQAADAAAYLAGRAQRVLLAGPNPDQVGKWVETHAARLRDAEAERDALRAQRNDAVATVAELAQRLTTREREHNADRAERDALRAEVERLRAELADLQGQSALTEHHFDQYVDDAIREQNTLRERVAVAERDAARWRRVEQILARAQRKGASSLDVDDLLEAVQDAEPGADDGACGDCATGRCHGEGPDDCDCDRHNASVEADRV